MRPLSTDEAFGFYDLMTARFLGWSVVLGAGRRTKDVDALFRRIMVAQPELVEMMDALLGGEDVVDLWPEDLRAIVRFEIEHKVPRAVNEPTSAEYAASMRESGRTDYLLPAFLADYGKPAKVEDHPPLPMIRTGRAAA